MKKKGVLITIIVILILLVLAGGAFAYVYFATDLLKTDKELFAKYFVRIGDEEKGMSSTSLTEYENKKLSTPYTNNGTFTVNSNLLTDASTDLTMQVVEGLMNYGNNTNISFSGKVDNPNKKVEENITINYTDTVNLPFTYKQVGDVYGIQADILSPSYISVENNNLQELFQKLGTTDVTNIPNKIEAQEIQSLQFTDEELTHISTQYIMPMYEGLSEEKFSKTENADGSNSYTLTITNIELRDILVTMLQTLKNDTAMLTKINSILAEMYQENDMTVTAENIQELIDSLTSADITEEMNIAITVTQNDGKTNKVDIKVDDVTIEMLMEQTDSNIVYTINLAQQGNIILTIQIRYEGITTNIVKEVLNITINVPDSTNTIYTFENTLNFGGTVEIADFDTNNSILINDYSEEQLQFLILQIAYIIEQTNTSQMTQIGFPTELGNPMIMWIYGPIEGLNNGTTVTDNSVA